MGQLWLYHGRHLGLVPVLRSGGAESMKRFRVCAILIAAVILSITGIAAAGPVKISGETKVEPYRLVELTADGAGPNDLVFWDIDQEAIADVRENGNRFLFVAPPGAYRIKVRVVPVTDGKISGPAVTQRAVVTIGASPGPGPGPGPTDPLAAMVQAAFAQETDPQRASQVSYMASVYKGMAAAPINDATVGDLFLRLKASLHAPGLGIPEGSLPKVSATIGAYLNSELGTSAMAPVDRVKAQTAFSKVAIALGGVK